MQAVEYALLAAQRLLAAGRLDRAEAELRASADAVQAAGMSAEQRREALARLSASAHTVLNAAELDVELGAL
jgi:hypothetical protein